MQTITMVANIYFVCLTLCVGACSALTYGTLYGLNPNATQLVIVDPTNAKITPVGSPLSNDIIKAQQLMDIDSARNVFYLVSMLRNTTNLSRLYSTMRTQIFICMDWIYQLEQSRRTLNFHL